MKEKTYSKSIANAIYDFLKEDDWHFSFDDKNGIFKFGLRANGPIKKISYIVDIKEKEYIVYAIPPLGTDETDEKMLSSMAEFICRVNYGLKNGNFELDMRDGEIRFKCYVDCAGTAPTKDIVKNSIYCPAVMFDHYGIGILSIILGDATAKKAMARCDNSLEDRLLAMLGEGLDEEENVDDIISQLTSGSDADEDESCSDNAQDSDSGEIDVKLDLFNVKGGTE